MSMFVDYSGSVLPRRVLFSRALRRGARDIWISSRDSLFLLVLCWAPILMPVLASIIASRVAVILCGAAAVLCLFGFAALLRSLSRRAVSTGLVMVTGLSLVVFLCLTVLSSPGLRIDFLIGGLAGGLLASAVNFVAYTVRQVKREARLG